VSPSNETWVSSYAAQTHQAKSRLRRFSHGARFGLATELAAPAHGSTLLDYGCGDGAYLRQLTLERPDLKLQAWHPFDDNRPALIEAYKPYPQVTVPPNVDLIPEGSIDAITCLEVMEHLPARVLDIELSRIERILRPGGVLAITVPIEVGPGSVGKNLARIATKTTHANTTARTIAKAGLGRSIGREDHDYILSHIGFDHRELRSTLLARGWRIEARQTSPLPIGGAVVNSQIGWRLRRG
jgi:2-polyprenyl-3-methyl-5-hydroxy-6-metoxy-1,4-benzoquinol methylase